MSDDRARFLQVLLTQPLVKADAIVCLCGEDCEPRLEVALQLFRQGGAEYIVVTGGRHDPPAVHGAEWASDWLVGKSVHPERVIVEAQSQNTREQAVNVLELADTRDWHNLLLVASTYHLLRAFLTFIKALDNYCTMSLPPTIRLIPVAASQAPWTATPVGVDRTRLELELVEYVKTQEYQQIGHCASYAAGLAYLLKWEKKQA
jgi:uncharacterized SAM-binding protein YcdF (DUF218 family)